MQEQAAHLADVVSVFKTGTAQAPAPAAARPQRAAPALKRIGLAA
jgi:hypothetical protein